MILTTKRDFIKGLFVAPAIIAVTNLMPVKLITDLAEIQETSSLLGMHWKLYNIDGNMRWMTPLQAELIKFDIGEPIKEMSVVQQTNRDIEVTVQLMKAVPGSAVMWELSENMKRYA